MRPLGGFESLLSLRGTSNFSWLGEVLGSQHCQAGTSLKTLSTLKKRGFLSSLILGPSRRANTKKSSLISEERPFPH